MRCIRPGKTVICTAKQLDRVERHDFTAEHAQVDGVLSPNRGVQSLPELRHRLETAPASITRVISARMQKLVCSGVISAGL